MTKQNNNYECCYTEVLELLKHIPKSEYEKIPKEKIEFFEKHKDKNYKYEYDVKNPKTLRKTDAVIVNLYKNYIAESNEKKKIEEILKLNYQKNELEKRKKYSNDVFKTKKEEQIQEAGLVEIKNEKFYLKIISFFKKLVGKCRKKS